MSAESSKVQFEEDRSESGGKKRLLYSRLVPSDVPPKTVRFLISHHIVKNERQAEFLLLSVFILCAAASYFILASQSRPTGSDISKEAVIQAILKGKN